MKELISSFPAQLKEALHIFRKTTLKPLPRETKNILISGLGGSGIGGTITAEICAAQSPVPINVIKDYSLPAWVSENTLVVISSYSGNTEETLEVLNKALERGAMIVAVSSGGEVLRLSEEKSFDAIVIPGGNPPRACLAYSLTMLCCIMEHYGFGRNLYSEIEKGIDLVEKESTNIHQEAEAIAKAISFSLPVIYTNYGYEGVAIRLRQQLNENAKMLCWHNVVPEMNHNELVGWIENRPKIAALFLRNPDEYYRNSKRMEFCKEIVSSFAGKTLEINSKGNSLLERVIYWIHLGDWISWYASVERQQDAMEINVINKLKEELSDLK